MRILIIEDDKEINKLLSVFLGKNGYDTVSSYDGVDGLNALKKYAKKNGGFSGGKSVADTDTNLQDSIDLILLDMRLPGFSGDEILTKIRSFTDIPVIVLTSEKSSEIENVSTDLLCSRDGEEKLFLNCTYRRMLNFDKSKIYIVKEMIQHISERKFKCDYILLDSWYVVPILI